jgi:hypothetical protein
MAVKYTKKAISSLSKITEVDIFGVQIYHLATLLRIR